MQLCDFGCGKEATHQFKTSGKWCCSKSANKCEGKRQKDAEKKAGKNPFEGREHPKGMKGKSAWNKGKTYEEIFSEEDVSRIKDALSASIYNRDRKAEWNALPEERKEKMRQTMRNNRIGGYLPGSGRGKSGRYKGIWCDSTWELAYLIYCLDHGVPIERNKARYPYTFEGKNHTYTPDFIVEGEVIEIKGYWTEREREKIRQCPVNVKIIDKETIEPYLNYAHGTYGINLVDLYE